MPTTRAVAAQIVAAVARAREVRDLADLIGEGALTETERRYLAFADVFTSVLVDQHSDEARTLEDTLARMWQVLSVLPRRELTMVAAADVAAYYFGDAPAQSERRQCDRSADVGAARQRRLRRVPADARSDDG